MESLVPEISSQDLSDRLGGEDLLLVDIREPGEQTSGLIASALPIAQKALSVELARRKTPLEQPIVLYCASGIRSRAAAHRLLEEGYRSVLSLARGVGGWMADGFPLAQSGGDSWRSRYARHLSIPEIGLAGQRKLLRSRVAIVGMGGLGCPAAWYLAAAGIGTLGLFDGDCVEESNLQRQTLHTVASVGSKKVDSAKERLLSFNPDLNIEVFSERLHRENSRDLDRFDLIIDGTDNFTSHYFLNDKCLELKKPLVFASVLRFEGQVGVWDGQASSPCYRCLYPEPPPPELCPPCADAGVVGAVPGILGSLQALEGIKLLLGIGKTLAGRLIALDGLTLSFREFIVERSPECPAGH